MVGGVICSEKRRECWLCFGIGLGGYGVGCLRVGLFLVVFWGRFFFVRFMYLFIYLVLRGSGI